MPDEVGRSHSFSNQFESSGTLTIVSWNVNGIRSVYRKGLLQWLRGARPDILCLQEIRADRDQIQAYASLPDGYHAFWNSAARPGYSGTAILTRYKPDAVIFGLGNDPFDKEGRTVVAEYPPSLAVISGYFPNGRSDHSRVGFKLRYYKAILQLCESYSSRGFKVVLCGDLNTAHSASDVARAGSRTNRTGFLPAERAWIDRLVASGYIDTFRHLHPDANDQYTWWASIARARERNVGWRFDYVFTSSQLVSALTDARIMHNVCGSDHCPVAISLNASLLGRRFQHRQFAVIEARLI